MPSDFPRLHRPEGAWRRRAWLAVLLLAGAPSARADDEPERGLAREAAVGDAIETREAGEREPVDPSGPDTGAPGPYWELVRSALTERAAGRVESAYALMRRAHALAPSARSLRALGVLSHARGRPTDTVRYLQAALATRTRALDGELRQVTEELLAQARGEVASVLVSTNPRNAQVALDGYVFVTMPLLALPGLHRLEVRAPGYVAASQPLRVAGGDLRHIQVDLLPAAPSTRHPLAHERPGRTRRLTLWIGGVSAVLVAGAVALGLTLRAPPGYERGNSGMLAGSP